MQHNIPKQILSSTLRKLFVCLDLLELYLIASRFQFLHGSIFHSTWWIEVGITFCLLKVHHSQAQYHCRKLWRRWMTVDICHTCQKVFCHPFPRSHTFIFEAKVPNVPREWCAAEPFTALRSLHKKKTCLDFHMERLQRPFMLCSDREIGRAIEKELYRLAECAECCSHQQKVKKRTGCQDESG